MNPLFRWSVIPLQVLAISVGAETAMAQSLADQIVGTWTLSEVYDQYENGTTNNPWGADVKGQLTYTQNGRFSLMIISAGRPKSDADPRTPIGPALGYFGTYTIHNDVVVHLTERSTFPNWEGIERPLTMSVNGNAMAQTAPSIGAPGQSYVPHLKWLRSR
jgi:Lipocalin-like domain